MEDKENSKYISKVIFIIFGVVALCIGVVGIITNVNFLRRNKGFKREKEKSSDIKFLLSLLAIFNICYLIDVLPFTYYNVKSIETLNYNYFCEVYQYIAYFAKFGVFYIITAISRDCCILAMNNPEYNKSNRFQMFVEALTVWSIHIVFLVLSDFFLRWLYRRHQCLVSHLTLLRELFVLIFVLVSLIFTFRTYCLAKHLNDRDSLTMHFIIQSRKTCFLYFLFWLPEFVSLFIRGPVEVIYYHEEHAMNVIWLLFIMLEYLSAAIFPYVWKTRVNVIVEHELM